MMTRKIREDRMKEDFMDIKNDLINDEVADLAINIYGILKVITDKYTKEATVYLVPELVKLLNRLDACIKVNEDLKSNISGTNDENTLLKKQLEVEKRMRKVDFEESLSAEENAEMEIEKMRSDIKHMDDIIEKLKAELEDKDKILDILGKDNDELTSKLNKQKAEMDSLWEIGRCEDSFTPPKLTAKKPYVKNDKFVVITENSFLPLSEEIPAILSKEKQHTVITTKAQVHRENSSTPVLNSRHQVRSNVPLNQQPKNKIIVFSDSQARNLSWYLYLLNISDEYNVTVYTKPGAKLKSIINDGKHLIQNLTRHDYLIVLAGTNDMHQGEPGQMTTIQGLNSLLSINTETNVIINSIPLRYDTTLVNDNICFANVCLEKKIKQYKGKLNLIYQDTNTFLQRRHYTKHGLHFNKHGKRCLARSMCDIIYQQRRAPRNDQLQPAKNKPTSPQQRTVATLHSPIQPSIGLGQSPPTTKMTVEHTRSTLQFEAETPCIYSPMASSTYNLTVSPSIPSLDSIRDFPPLPSPKASTVNVSLLNMLNDECANDSISKHVLANLVNNSTIVNDTESQNETNINKDLFLDKTPQRKIN